MKKMILLAVLFPIFLTSCSDDDSNTYTIENQTGITWYDAQVWFKESLESGSKATDYEDLGTVKDGQRVTFKTKEIYYYIYAYDADGNLILSKVAHLTSKKNVVGESDIY